MEPSEIIDCEASNTSKSNFMDCSSSNQEVVKLRHCPHHFHYDCIRMYMQRCSRGGFFCPTCNVLQLPGNGPSPPGGIHVSLFYWLQRLGLFGAVLLLLQLHTLALCLSLPVLLFISGKMSWRISRHSLLEGHPTDGGTTISFRCCVDFCLRKMKH